MGLVAASVLVAAVATKGVRNHRTVETARAIEAPVVHSVFIQKDGALDPITEGFKTHIWGHFEGNVMRNSANYGFDRWRTVSDDAGYYYRPLTDPEKDFAENKDWILTCVCAAGRGDAFAAISFGKRAIMRFDIVLLEEGGKYFVGLTKKITPAWEFEKVEFAGIADADHPHIYQLRYDHLAREASLWIDDRKFFNGYRGVDQFREDRGLFFGSWATRESRTGVGIFRTVRFEAH